MVGDAIWTWWFSTHYTLFPRKSEAWGQPGQTFLYRGGCDTGVVEGVLSWSSSVTPASAPICSGCFLGWGRSDASHGCGNGSKTAPAEEVCTGSTITVTKRWTKGGYVYEDWGSPSNFNNMKQDISRRNNWPAAIRDMVQLTTWCPSIKIPATLRSW